MYNDPDAQTMNYNIAIYGGVVVLSTVYYFFFWQDLDTLGR